jgi:hypothetical protein
VFLLLDRRVTLRCKTLLYQNLNHNCNILYSEHLIYGLYVCTCVFLLCQESFNIILVNNLSFYDGGVTDRRSTTRWVINTGLTNHMTGARAAITELDITVQGMVRFDDGLVVWIEGCSTVIFDCKNDEHRVFTDIYYTPRLKANIISISYLDEAGYDVHIGSGMMQIKDADGRLLAKIPRAANQLYVLHVNVAHLVCLLAQGEEEDWRRHAHLGHLNFQ